MRGLRGLGIQGLANPLFGAGCPGGVSYVLLDDFTTDLAAGSINGTLATPGPGTRSTTDTTPGALVTGGRYSPRTNVAWGDPNLSWAAVARVKGRMLVGKVFPRKTTNNGFFGFAESFPVGAPMQGTITFRNLGYVLHYPTNAEIMPTYSSGVLYPIAVIARAAGIDLFVQLNGTWELMWRSFAENAANIYPSVCNILEAGHVAIPEDLWMLTPLVSDGFGGAFGTSDGLGHAETTGLGSGGSGVAWAQRVGTWANSTGKAYGTVDGGLAITTISPGSDNVMVDVSMTRSGGNLGVVLRYTDVNNYVYCYHNGTQVSLRKVVGGVDSEVLAATTATYSAGAILRVKAKGTLFKVYYNNKGNYGGDLTISDAVLQSGSVGLYTTDTGNGFDNFVSLAVGIEDQYSYLNRFIPSIPYVNCWFYGDSKTAGTGDEEGIGGYKARMSTESRNFYQVPATILTITAEAGAAAIDAALVAAVGTPDYILINIGNNDLAGIHGGSITEAAWKANYAYILDAMHTKWADAGIYCMRPWYLAYSSAANTCATWIAALVAARSSFCYLGPDERVFLENGDGGATYISGDGIHPNAAGYALTAVQWKSLLGY